MIVLSIGSAWAAEEGLRAFRLPQVLLESEPEPASDLQIPPSAYPLTPVERAAFHGSRHGLVNTTTGTLAFKGFEIRLPGRMPLEFGPVYGSGISENLPPAAPGQGNEPRWVKDLGKNWILGYSAYLKTLMSQVLMATPEGDMITWNDVGGGNYQRNPDVASRHWKLETTGPSQKTETRADGTKWIYDFTGFYQTLSRIEDRSGNSITFTYTNGLLSHVENSDGAWIDILRPVFDPNYPPISFPDTRVVQITDSTGREMHFDYDSAGLLTSITDVLGNVWTFSYAANDKLASATDPLGNEYLTVTYDTENRVATYEAGHGAWTFDYSQVNTTKATDALGNEWQYEYNATTGITTRITEPTGGVHEIVLDTNNNPTTYTGPEGATATWSYDSEHRPLTYQAPGTTGSVVYAYDSTDGWVDSITGIDGAATTFTRDAAGRVTEEAQEDEPSDPSPSRWTATYDSNGDRLTFRLPKGNDPGPEGFLWTFDHDSFGNVTTAIDPLGRTFELEYTPQGDLWKLRRPDHEDEQTQETVFAEWVYDRDLLGRVTSLTDPLGNTWSWTYDEAGRLARRDGPAGTAIRYAYGTHYRVNEIIRERPGGTDLVTALAYDSAARLESKTIPGGSAWSYGYDESSRLASITDPLGRATVYGRDLAGKILSITHPGGRQVVLTRDTAGRLTARTFPGGRSESFQYDGSGRLSRTDIAEGTDSGYVEWTWDALGRPKTIVTNYTDGTVGSTHTLTYDYDLNGNVVSRSVSVPGTIWNPTTFTYDDLDRVISTTGPDYGPWTAQYDPVSGSRTRVDHAFFSNDCEEWDYDLAGRVVGHRWGVDQTGTCDASGGNFTWTLDAEGRRISETDNLTGKTIQLDYTATGLPEHREETEDGVLTTTDFVYNDDGRLVQSTMQEGTEDPVESAFQWDAAGRVTLARQGNTTRTYTWEDAPDNLAAAVRVWRAPDDLTERAIEVDYDCEGRLLEVTGYHVDEQPTVIGRYFWLPFEETTLLTREDIQQDGSYESAKRPVDLAGEFAESDLGGTQSAALSDVTVTEKWGAMREFLPGAPMPDLDNPFRLGHWTATQPYELEARLTPSASGTGLGSARSLVDELRASGPGGEITIDPSFPGTKTDVLDDWTGELIQARGLTGDSAKASSHVSPQVTDPMQGSGGTGPIWKNPGEYTMVWGWLYGYGTSDDPNAVNVNVCGGGPPIQFERGHGRPCNMWILGYGSGGGGGQCVFDWRYDRPVGDADSFNYPDTSPTGVSMVNGEFTTSSTDLSVFDRWGDISFTRTYRSGIRYEGTLGWRWYHNWDEKLDFGRGEDGNGVWCGNKIRWISADGSYLEFAWDPQEQVWVAPPGSSYRLRESSGSQYEIRSLSGTVKTFFSDGRLEKIARGGHTIQLFYSGNGLASVSSDGGGGLTFHYNMNGKLSTVTGGGQSVTFEYNACDELSAVERPATELEAGGSPASQPPRTEYAYRNGADCSSGATENHKLEEIRVFQENPLAAESSPVTVVMNRYHDSTEKAVDIEFMRVERQCFGTATCEPGDPRIEYSYASGSTTMTDYRDTPAIAETHTFSENLLQSVVENSGASESRETTYTFADGLLTKVVHPDGTCDLKKYSQIAGIDLVVEDRQSYGAGCQGTPQPATDLVTRYTYEPFIGKVRTVTRPEAFLNDPNLDPDTFDPDDAAARPYTTYYDYDLHQTSATGSYPTGLADFLAQWGFQCPAECPDKLGDINGDPSDDEQYLGSVVRETRYAPDGTAVVVTRVNQDGGRPKKVTRPDGTATEYEYYTGSPWDWRQSGAGTDPTGSGPLAIERLVPEPAEPPGPSLTPLETRYAWRTDARMIAREDPPGTGIERDLSVRGDVLEKRVCSDVTACTGSVVLRKTRHTYDLRGRELQTMVLDAQNNDALVARTWTTYDVLGRPTSVTVDPDTVTDPNITPGAPKPEGSEGFLHLLSRTFYDGRGRAVKTVSPEGRVTCSTYDNLGRLTEVKRRYVLDADCTTPDARDVTVTTTYDVMDRMFSATDGNGHTTYRWYDAFGRPEFVSDGKPTAATIPTFAGPPPSMPAEGAWQKETLYDDAAAVGAPARVRFKGGDGKGSSGYLKVSWQEYDKWGRPTRSHVAVADGFVPAVDADSTSPSGPRATTETRYLTDGRVDEREDPAQRVLKFQYDDFARPWKTLLPAKSGDPGSHQDSKEVLYDADGRVEERVQTSYGPDYAAHIERVRTDYDDWGRVRRTVGDPDNTDNTALVTTFEYDALDRARKSIVRWDAAADQGSAEDPNDRIRKTEYDAAGRVSKVSIRASAASAWAETEYGYDEDGLMTSLQDAEGNKTTWEYAGTDAQGNAAGGLGRILRMKYPMDAGAQQTVEFVQYDGNGNVTDIQHRKDDDADAPAVDWANSYDEFNHLKERVASLVNADSTEFWGTSQQTFDYDDLGRMVRAVDTTTGETDITVAFSYDTAGRLRNENQAVPVDGTAVNHAVTSNYDLDGFRNSLEYPGNGYELTFTPDWLGRLAEIEGPQTPTTPTVVGRSLLEYQYAGSKVWKRKSGNGIATRFSDPFYDGLGRLRGMRTVTDDLQESDPDFFVVSDFQYGYDRVGNRTFEQRQHEPDGGGTAYRTRAYSQDLMGRLEKWRDGYLGTDPIAPTLTDPTSAIADVDATGEESWGLDKIGNWTSKGTGVNDPTPDNYLPNDLNQYAQVSPDGGAPKAFEFDWLGQLRRDEQKGQRYVWDLFGRLTKVQTDNDPPGAIAEYRYDALNRRVEKVDHTPGPGDQTTHYFYDGWRVIEERAVVGDPAAEEVRAWYGFGLGLDEVAWMDRDYDAAGGPDTRYFTHQDGLGSVTAVTDDPATGVPSVVERYTYSAYGDVTVWAGAWDGSGYPTNLGNVSAIGLPCLYTGQRLDTESGLYYAKNRFYDTGAGRFLRRDLVGYSAGPSLYQYAASNPSLFNDPLGLRWQPGSGKSESAKTIDEEKYSRRRWAYEASLAYFGDMLEAGWYETTRTISFKVKFSDVPLETLNDLGVTWDPENGIYHWGDTKFPADDGWWVQHDVLVETWRNPLLDNTQTGLDAASIAMDATGIGATVSWVPDVLNGLISGARGDWLGLGMSAGAAIPMLGIVLNEARLARRAAREGAEVLGEAARGGTYVLKDGDDVMRTGRTIDLGRRAGEHARNPATSGFKFEAIHHTDDYATQRGLEQMLHEEFDPPLDRINGISPRNPNRDDYLQAAEDFLGRGGT